MADETETKPFDFSACPWCGGGYRNRQVLKVECDEGGPCRLYLQCDRCGVVYKVERVISWKATKATGGEHPSQEVGKFLEERAERVERARRRISNH
jgi:uncharacterized C2H2 Zn-finger protein